MVQNRETQLTPGIDGDKRTEQVKATEPGTAASTKMYTEASSDWHRQASEARKAPLAVQDGQSYEVKHGDCLSDIAARRLRTDHEKVDSHSIAKEEKRLRELNGDEFKSLESKNKKDRDFLADGWHLKIYDSVHDKQQVTPAETNPAANARPTDGAPANPAAPRKAEGVPADVPLPPVRPPEFSGAPRADVPLPTPRPDGAPRSDLTPPPADVPLPPRRPEISGQPPTGDQPQQNSHAQAPEVPPSEHHHRHRHHKGRRHHHSEGPSQSAPEHNSPDAPPPTGDNPAPVKHHRRDTTEAPEGRAESRPENSEGPSPEGKLNRSRFYTHQTDNHSCAGVALAMMHANEETGRPPSAREVEHFKAVTGTEEHGYRGSLESMANQARSQGMEAKAYQYGRFGENGMRDLDSELAAGHSAVARIINPHTGNPHYIYIAGKDSRGDYVIGDPDRKNNANFGHDAPISRAHLMHMMSGRDGFVAGWA